MFKWLRRLFPPQCVSAAGSYRFHCDHHSTVWRPRSSSCKRDDDLQHSYECCRCFRVRYRAWS